MDVNAPQPSRAAVQKKPSVAFQTAVASSAHRAAQAAQQGLTAEENGIIARYLSARSKLQRVAEAQAVAAKANAALFGDRAPQSNSAAITAAKAAIREYMEEEDLDVLELQPGHVVRVVSKRGTGAVKPEDFVKAATSINVDTVRAAMLRVLGDAATAMEKHAKQSAKPRRQRGKVDKRMALFDSTDDAVDAAPPSVADDSAAPAGVADDDGASKAGARDSSASSVASSARSSIASSVESAISDSVRRVQDKHGKAVGVSVDRVLQLAVTDADCAATVGALDVTPGSRASLLHKHTEGDVDIATALAEAMYTVINPEVRSMSIVKTVPKRDDALRVGAFPDDADAKLTAARRVIVESRAPKPKPAAPKATNGDATADSGVGKPMTGTEAARKTVTELGAAVSDIVRKRGVGNDTDAPKLPVKVREADGNGSRTVHLSAKSGVTTVRKFTWTAATRALRFAAASVLMDTTDIDPDLPCAEMLSKSADVLPAITDKGVLTKVLNAVSSSVKAFEAAHTVQYSTATVHKHGGGGAAAAASAAGAVRVGGAKRPAPLDTSASSGVPPPVAPVAAETSVHKQASTGKRPRPAFAAAGSSTGKKSSGKPRPAFVNGTRNKD